MIRAIRSHPPGELLEIMASFWRGVTCRARYAFNPRVRIGSFFRRDCRVEIKGPGRVDIGNHVQFTINAFEGVTIITTSPEARVVVGDRSLLGGVCIACSGSISIGADCLLAPSFLTDRDFPGDPSEIPGPISVGDNCWLTETTALLKDSSLGAGCVLAVGSVLAGRKVGERMMVVGSPARPVIRLGK